MTPSQALLVLKALMAVIPVIVNMVRDGRIRAASQTEVLDALQQLVSARVEKARRAKDDDSAPDPYQLRNDR